MTMPCIFPFIYGDVTYTKCAGTFLFDFLDGAQAICPVGDEMMVHDGSWYEKGQWGICDLKPKGICRKTEGRYEININVGYYLVFYLDVKFLDCLYTIIIPF